MPLYEHWPLDPNGWSPELQRSEIDRQRILDIVYTPGLPRQLRNRLVTMAYQDLSKELRRHFPDHPTWCSYAQWSSNVLHPVLARRAFRSSRGLSGLHWGNRNVLAQVGWATLALLAELDRGTFVHDQPPQTLWPQSLSCETTVGSPYVLARYMPKLSTPIFDQDRKEPVDPVKAYWAPLVTKVQREYRRPGEHPPNKTLDDHEAALLLDISFTACLTSARTGNAGWLVVANAYLAELEQRRVQPALVAAFRHPVRALAWWNRLASNERLRSGSTSKLVARVEEHVAKALTTHVVRVPVSPTEALVAAEGVPSCRPVLVSEWTGQQRALLDALGYEANRAVTDWTAIPQRMGFILDLFRQVRPEPDGPLGPETRAAARREAAAVQAKLPAQRTFSDAPECPVDGHDLDDARARTDPVAGPCDRQQLKDRYDADIRSRWAQLLDRGDIDCETTELVKRLVEQHEPLYNIGLFSTAIPETYAAAKGVLPVAALSALASEPVHRLVRTAQFVRAVCTSPATETEPPGLDQLSATRQHHDALRRALKIPRDTPWGVDLNGSDMCLGEPANHEDMLATALSFSIPVLDMFKRLGVSLRRDQRLALVRHWLVIGHLLGVPRDLIGPDDRLWDEREARQIVDRVRYRHARRSLAGVHLMEELREDVSNHVPIITRRLPSRIIRLVGDPRILDLLLAPRPRRRPPLDALLCRVLRHSSNPVGHAVWRWWFGGLSTEEERHRGHGRT